MPSMLEPVNRLLHKQRIIAGPGFNRWLVPPAALAIHLCIGMAYGFSVFWIPLAQAIGISAPRTCGPEVGFLAELFTTQCDWRISTLVWMYTLFFVLLGCSAALWGGWLERAGPRKAGVVSACCWCGGLLVSALGVHLHQFWLMLLGSGVIGGIGLGLGYISPVSTLIKWFPDRRGMATGMAIMGFGGGAMVGSPLAADLMAWFSGPHGVGVAPTFVVLALGCFAFMLAGALTYRVPPSGWKPEGWTPAPAQVANAMVTARHVHARHVWRVPQFWLLWVLLCMNVSAGIGVIGMASPMLQEVFGGALLGLDQPLAALDASARARVAAVAAGFAALLSLFNIAGRFAWASLSDRWGRQHTYTVFFVLGAALYAALPAAAGMGEPALFVALLCVIVSMYGGAFATVPAYLADLFGTQMVGAIHGRLLTAWATAGVLGPVVVNHMREYQLAQGLSGASAYGRTMLILSGMLLVGLACNLVVRPLAPRHFMSDEELAAERRLAHERSVAENAALHARHGHGAATPAWLVVLAWVVVGLPLAWGLWRTLAVAATLLS